MSEAHTNLDELPRDERLLLMRFVCSFAWADDQVQPAERELVSRYVRRLKLEADEIEQVNTWLDETPSGEPIDPRRVPAEHRMLFLRAMESIIAVDGEVTPSEREALLRFAKLGR